MSGNQKPMIELDQSELLTLYGSSISDLLGLKVGDPKSALGLKVGLSLSQVNFL